MQIQKREGSFFLDSIYMHLEVKNPTYCSTAFTRLRVWESPCQEMESLVRCQAFGPVSYMASGLGALGSIEMVARMLSVSGLLKLCALRSGARLLLYNTGSDDGNEGVRGEEIWKGWSGV